jgi:hypothetical protein
MADAGEREAILKVEGSVSEHRNAEIKGGIYSQMFYH